MLIKIAFINFYKSTACNYLLGLLDSADYIMALLI